MVEEKLLAPDSATAWLIAIFVIGLVLLLAWVAWRIWDLLRRKRSGMYIRAVSFTDRDRWIRRIDEVFREHSASDDDARLLHLALAAELRTILSERATTDLSSWTPRELAEVPAFDSAASVIASWEEPSFAPYAQVNAVDARDRAVQVVSAW